MCEDEQFVPNTNSIIKKTQGKSDRKEIVLQKMWEKTE